MAELKTAVIHSEELSMAGNTTVKKSEELIAEQNMRIVGVLFAFTAFIGNDAKCCLIRSGTYTEPGSYVEDEEMSTQRGVMFAARAVDGSETQPNQITFWEMLHSNHFFFLEKGERIYFHCGHHNNSAATHSSSMDCIIFYY